MNKHPPYLNIPRRSNIKLEIILRNVPRSRRSLSESAESEIIFGVTATGNVEVV